MPNKAYNLEFRMLLEGLACPFYSVDISCTPNGVEANINIYANREALNIKPKTAVQIFYRDWVAMDGKQSWRLCFDGFFSSYYQTEDSQGGRGLGIICRDFRMDMRKAPAAMAWENANEISVQDMYNTAGIFQTYTIKGISTTKKKLQTDIKGAPIRTYGDSGIDDVATMIRRIAGTAAGVGANVEAKRGDYSYGSNFGKDCPLEINGKKAEAGLYLDAVVRGMWAEASNGSAVGIFMNRRTRVDKRFFTPRNRAGYNFWSRQNSGIQVGSYLLGNSRFSSLEAAIMRLAGLFSCRVYSCSTPSLIPVADDIDGAKNYAADYVMLPQVREYMVKNPAANFGAPYILNETMLLPPFEFTAPPNCNLMFPPMYDNVSWQYDVDADYTRGYFTIIDSLTTPSSTELASATVQVPNALFDIVKEEGNKNDAAGRHKPPLTLEERYKGVNVMYSNVEYNIAADDSSAADRKGTFSQKKVKEVQAAANKFRSKAHERVDFADPELKKEYDSRIAEIEKSRSDIGSNDADGTRAALKHHAVLKYLNVKYAGRVANVNMHFNPFIMCGFPGAVIADELNYPGNDPLKTILGMVQQVKHRIVISTDGAEASTNVVMNNARFEDEPTDIDYHGDPQFLPATVRSKADVDPSTWKYTDENYKTVAPLSPYGNAVDLNNTAYDLDQRVMPQTYKYAKDLLSTSHSDDPHKSNSTYLDVDYMPSRVDRFYYYALQHKNHSFMLGRYGDHNEKWFAYDTMHEALSDMRSTHKELMSDYEAAIRFVWRNVCSADAFYHGILGLSSPESERVLDSDTWSYVNRKSNFKDDALNDEYFGITTDMWESIEVNNLKYDNGGLMNGPGEMSSVLEHIPITAFTMERKDSARRYIDSVNIVAQGRR